MLQRELETYERELGHLLQHEGRFVLIHDDQVGGIFSSYEDALQAGYDQFGLEPFMVKRISAIEQVQSITRPIDPCPT